MLAARTMKASSVMAKMAGIESTAKATSVLATTSSTAKIGVARRRPRSRTKIFCPR
jgi:hypothetical protein